MTKRDRADQFRLLKQLEGLGFTWQEAEDLRRISRTLRKWFERECGDSNAYGSWAIERDDDDGPPYLVHHHWGHGRQPDTVTRTRIPDREAGARRRLKTILSRVNLHARHGVMPDGSGDPNRIGALSAYVQTDPRGCALYLLRLGDVPEGEDPSAFYTRGLAIY